MHPQADGVAQELLFILSVNAATANRHHKLQERPSRGAECETVPLRYFKGEVQPEGGGGGGGGGGSSWTICLSVFSWEGSLVILMRQQHSLTLYLLPSLYPPLFCPSVPCRLFFSSLSRAAELHPWMEEDWKLSYRCRLDMIRTFQGNISQPGMCCGFTPGMMVSRRFCNMHHRYERFNGWACCMKLSYTILHIYKPRTSVDLSTKYVLTSLILQEVNKYSF